MIVHYIWRGADSKSRREVETIEKRYYQGWFLLGVVPLYISTLKFKEIEQ